MEEKKFGYKALIYKNNYMKMMLSNIINRLGDAVDTLAFTWLVYSITHSATWAAVIFGANKVPAVFLEPLAGAYVEKLDKRKCMIIADTVRCVLVITLIVCFKEKKLGAVLLLVFSVLFSSAEAFRSPASTAYVTQLLDKDLLKYGLSFNTLVSIFVELIGTGVGGIIIGKLGVTIAFEFDAVTFLVSIFIVLLIESKEVYDSAQLKDSYLKTLADGIKYVFNNKKLRFAIVMTVIGNGVMCPIDSLQSPIVVELFGQTSGFLTAMNVSISIGMLVGGGLYPIISKRIKYLRMLSLGYFGIALTYLGVVIISSLNLHISIIQYVLIILLYFIYGLATAGLASSLGVEFINSTDQRYIARSSTIYNSIGTAIIAVISFATGLAVKIFSMREIFVAIFIITLITSIYARSKKVHVENKPEKYVEM